MRFVSGLGTATLVAAIGLIGCQDPNKEHYPGLPDCTGQWGGTPPPGSIAGSGGAGGGGTGGAGTGGAGTGGTATITQSGTVHRIVSQDFVDTATGPYTGVASIAAYPDKGAMTTQPYGGTVGTTFTFAGIPAVPTWFFVEDKVGGGSGILSTFSRANLPVAAGFALPVIDVGTLQIIAASLPGVGTIGPGAQIILFVSQANAPLAGVQVTGGAGSAQIAYDSGPAYTDGAAAATGPRGTILLLNSALSGKATITLTDTATTKTYDVEVQTAQGAATIAGFNLP